jgi:hypothetical protein
MREVGAGLMGAFATRPLEFGGRASDRLLERREVGSADPWHGDALRIRAPRTWPALHRFRAMRQAGHANPDQKSSSGNEPSCVAIEIVLPSRRAHSDALQSREVSALA